VARDNPPASVPVVITFTGANTYTRSDDAVNTYAYVSGTAIEANLPNNYPTTPYTYTALDNWSLTLQGIPKIGDTFTVEAQPAAFRNLNSGNASAMMNLRDAATFDGAALTDGYASLIAQIGIRSQSASYTAGVSSAIAESLEKDRTALSGVNLDEEAAKLLQYQQAYQASAKVIQIAQGIFDTLIQTISR
jgi:flagellar hook-associated protein 1